MLHVNDATCKGSIHYLFKRERRIAGAKHVFISVAVVHVSAYAGGDVHVLSIRSFIIITERMFGTYVPYYVIHFQQANTFQMASTAYIQCT